LLTGLREDGIYTISLTSSNTELWNDYFSKGYFEMPLDGIAKYVADRKDRGVSEEKDTCGEKHIEDLYPISPAEGGVASEDYDDDELPF
jgi:hypothetical protein